MEINLPGPGVSSPFVNRNQFAWPRLAPITSRIADYEGVDIGGVDIGRFSVSETGGLQRGPGRR
jgi:hypothetical protein